MAQSTRDIKRRMQTVQNTQQITKAMEMISAAKLRKAQERVDKTRPYRERIANTLVRVLATASREGEDVPAIAGQRSGERSCLIVITADRGLAGGYNANILRKADEFLRDNPDTQLVLIGRKARDYYRRRNQSFLADYVYLGDNIRFGQAQEISQVVQEFYVNDLFDRVLILYTQFVNTVTHRAVIQQILPLADVKEADAKQQGVEPLYWYEPSVGEVLQSMVPLYIDTVIYQALIESNASEQGARMNAMRNASDNAGELMEQLNLSYNRARQAGITKELSEIVGGAEALES